LAFEQEVVEEPQRLLLDVVSAAERALVSDETFNIGA
jgi:hypothetical protein